MSLRNGVGWPVRGRSLVLTLTLAFTSWTTSLPAAQDTRRFQVPSAIERDCSRDVTDVLNRWIAAVPDGKADRPSVLEFGKEACYRVDGTLGTAYGTRTPAGFGRRYLEFQGNGSTISGRYAMPAVRTNRAGLSFVFGEGITIRDFVIEGNHPNPCNLDSTGSCRDGGYDSNREWQHGIALFATSDVVVKSNRIRHVYGDGIMLAQGESGEGSVQRVLVEDNEIDGTGRMGVGVTAGIGVTIAGNRFDRISYHVIDLENEAGQPVQNVVIKGNTLGRKYLGFIAASSSDCVADNQHDVSIIDNVETASGVTTWPSIYVDAYTVGGCPFPMTWRNYEISRNTLLHSDTSGAAGDNQTMKLGKLTNVRIAGNRIMQGDTAGSAIKIYGTASRFEITDNDMREAHPVYTLANVADASGIEACGNRTNRGINQPRPCTSSGHGSAEGSTSPGPAATGTPVPPTTSSRCRR